MPHGEGTLLNDGLRIVGHFRYGKIIEMKEGKGATKEIIQKLTYDSKSEWKSVNEGNPYEIKDNKTIKIV